jgi:hypothetical protein
MAGHPNERVGGSSFRRRPGSARTSANVSVGLLRRYRNGGAEHQAFRPLVIRMNSNGDQLIERNVGGWAIRAGKYQFTAKSIASRKLPTQPK